MIACFVARSVYLGGLESLSIKASTPKAEPNATQKEVIFEMPPELDFESQICAEPAGRVVNEEKPAQSEEVEKLPLLLYRGNAKYPPEDSVAKYGGLDAVHE